MVSGGLLHHSIVCLLQTPSIGLTRSNFAKCFIEIDKPDVFFAREVAARP